MDFRLSDDQEALRRGMRELLTARFGPDELRGCAGEGAGAGSGAGSGGDAGTDAEVAGSGGAGADGGGPVPDAALWRELGEAGFFALRLSEEAGGVGLGLPEAVLVFEEAGRALLPGPLVATELAAGLVPGAAEGAVRVTALDAAGRTPVEHLESAGRVLVLGAPGTPVRMVGGGADGESRADGAAGAEGAPGAGAFAGAVPLRSVDPLSPLHRVPEGSVEGAGEVVPEVDVGRLRREGALLTAALQLGSAGRSVETAVGYAREREQFGRPIGSFQAVKHLCAGMLVRSETARSVVYAAAVTEDESEIHAAKLLADEAAVDNARDCLQVHGGMGFTWEAEVHLHLKRAWLRSRQWLTAVTAEEELAAVL